MKKHFVLLFLMISVLQLNAQWNVVYSDTTVDYMSDIKYFNEQLIAACGSNNFYDGRVWTSRDNGETWVMDTAGFRNNGISVPSLSAIYSVGCDGSGIKSVDGGLSWQSLQIVPLPTDDLTDVFFINDSLGFAYKYKILRTVDGGNSWSSQFGFQLSDNSESMDGAAERFCLGDDLLFFASPGGIYSSPDSGLSWGPLQEDSSLSLRSIFMFNDYEGFASSFTGSLLHTSDGWLTYEIRQISDQGLHGVTFINDSVGLMGAGGFYGYGDGDTCGMILYTRDRGQNWFGERFSDKRICALSCHDSTCFAVSYDRKIFRCDNLISYVNHVETICNTSFQIYPNPVNNLLHLDFSDEGTISITIMDVKGEIVMRRNSNGSSLIDMEQMPSGIYFICIESEKLKTIKKVIKL